MSLARPVLAAALAATLAACSPAEPPPPAQKPMTGGAGQALVQSQAHLMGELPAYGNVTWERQADAADGSAVLVLAPGQAAPTITARIRDGRIVEFVQKGSLARKPLAALAAAAGAPPGQHGPTAEKVEALVAKAKAEGREASGEIGGATWTAAPSGDEVRATPKP